MPGRDLWLFGRGIALVLIGQYVLYGREVDQEFGWWWSALGIALMMFGAEDIVHAWRAGRRRKRVGAVSRPMSR